MLRNVHIWLLPYLQSRLTPRSRRANRRHVHLIFCFVDHFEPLWRCDDDAVGLQRLSRWIERYEAAAPEFRDSDGRRPRHTYFFPLDAYREEQVRLLAEHCARGFGEVEFHLHHDNDTPEHFVTTIERFKKIFDAHGLLARDERGDLRYGFVHGNWALDNSRPDGRWCGLNNELTLLNETGCYADFTLPSAPSATQTKMINSIYYALDDPGRPKSHNTGIPVRVHGSPPKGRNHLLIVQGPLGINWSRRRFGVVPRIENSELNSVNPSTEYRWKLWVQSSVSVQGRPDWIFVKVFAHGCEERTFGQLFEAEGFRKLHTDLANVQRKWGNFDYHFVTARELYNMVKAAEAGNEGNPYVFKDFLLSRRG